MPPRRNKDSLPNVLVVEPCQEIRQALVEHLASEGFQASGTNSMEVACRLVKGSRVRLVLVNLSAFPMAALCELARALAGRVGVRLLGLVSQVGPEEIPGAASEGLGDEGTRDRPIPTLVLRLSGPDEMTIGGRAWRPN
jgi:DNA-binding NtrC family response regulator